MTTITLKSNRDQLDFVLRGNSTVQAELAIKIRHQLHDTALENE